MSNMQEVFKRVCDWNAKRYEQEYDEALAYSLLIEELDELIEAPTAVDQLDALCDIIFVAMGCAWKTGADTVTVTVIETDNAVAIYNASIVHAPYMRHYLMANSVDAVGRFGATVQAFMTIIVAASQTMTDLGLSEDQIAEALLVVCDSNDSKSVTKTASHIKANKDKGALFIAPEPRLQRILDACKNS